MWDYLSRVYLKNGKMQLNSLIQALIRMLDGWGILRFKTLPALIFPASFMFTEVCSTAMLVLSHIQEMFFSIVRPLK